MSVPEEEILSKLTANYQKAMELIPPDMVEEFQKKIIRLRDLEEYAQIIAIGVEFKDENVLMKVQNWIAERFAKGHYGRRLVAARAEPDKIYEKLLSGIYDYK